MQTYTQAFNDAIRATDREIRGYLEFNTDSTKRMYGSDGLISFVCHLEMQDAERFCFSSKAANYCEASFFNDGLPAGVSLANSYFVPWVGVKVVQTDADSDVEAVPYQTADSGTTITADFTGVPDGCEAVFRVGSDYYTGTFDYTNGISVEDGEYKYSIYPSGSVWYFAAFQNLSPILDTYNVGLTVPAYEWKSQGRYYITEISREKETTAIVGYSEIAYKMSGQYTPTITPSASGYKVLDILNDIIDQTGCNNGQHYSGYNYYIPEIVEGTCAEQFMWLTTMNRSTAANLITGAAASLSGTQMGYRQWNTATYTSYPAITDDQIYMDGLQLGDTFTITSLTTGTQDNPIVCGSGVGPNNPNPYISSAQATTIYNAIKNQSYTPMTLHWRGDPCISLFDTLKVTTGGTDYKCVAMRITSTFNGGFEQTIDCWGDGEAYYEMSYSPMEAKIQTNNTLIKEIAQAIETADGGVITKVLDTDGTWKELVIANNQDLSQATSVWRWNINGLGHSTSYSGGTYTFALDDQGRIVATLIQTGILQDALGNNYWNLDTGAFQITNGTINITTTSSTDNRVNLQYSSSSTVSWMNQMSPYNLFVYSRNGTNYYETNYKSDGSTHVYYSGGTLISNKVSESSLDYTALQLGSATKLMEVTSDGYYVKSRTNWGTATTRGLLGENGLTFYNSSGTQTAFYPATAMTSKQGTNITNSVSNATDTKVVSVTLDAGRYLLYGFINFPDNSTGRRFTSISSSSTSTTTGLVVSDSRAPASGGATRVQVSGYVNPTATTTYYLWVYQNSGSTMTLSSRSMYAVQII